MGFLSKENGIIYVVYVRTHICDAAAQGAFFPHFGVFAYLFFHMLDNGSELVFLCVCCA